MSTWSILHKLTRSGPATDEQLRQFVANIAALSEQLRPKRRPQDRNTPECSLPELRALSALGQRHPLTMSELAAILEVPANTATHTVDKLVAKGLLERKRLPQDRRIVTVAFSKKGQRIDQYVRDTQLAAARRLLGALSSGNRQVFLDCLAAVSSTLRS